MAQDLQQCAAVHAYVSNLTLKLLDRKRLRCQEPSEMASFGKSASCTQASEVLKDTTIARQVASFLEEHQSDIASSSSSCSCSSPSCSSTDFSTGGVVYHASSETTFGIASASSSGAQSDADLSDDDGEDLIVFEESSFSICEAAVETPHVLSEPRTPLVGRMTGAVTHGVTYTGSKLRSLSESLDNKAESAAQRVEELAQDTYKGSSVMMDSMIVMDEADKYMCAFDDFVTAQAALVANKCGTACQVFDTKATEYAQRFQGCFNSGAVKISSKAKATAAAVRSKTGDISTTEGRQKSLEAARSKVQPPKVRMGWQAARDKMQSAFSSKNSRESSISQGGA